MTDHWDFYMCRVDNQPASIFLDLGLGSSAPITELPWLGYIRLYMRNPREDGLSSNEEYEELGLIEDELEQHLNQPPVALYVGRNTSEGCRDFYFYMAESDNWDSKVQQVMQCFQNYKFESGTREDIEWDTYKNFLYPTEIDMQRIQDRSVIEHLKSHGDSLTTPREILHWIYFPHPLARQAFEGKAKNLGFNTHHYLEPDADLQEYGIILARTDRPSYHDISNTTLALFTLAKEYGGNYDGWETEIIS